MELGTTLMTSGVSAEVQNNDQFATDIQACLVRHTQHDWGDIDSDDAKLNDLALRDGYRVLSAYDINPKIWIITEADRTSTTILFPEEY